ncbi:MAG: zinc-ribbon domain-containing protein [Nitrososphaerales archaeon]
MTQTASAFCRNCGSPSQAGSKFCQKCGTQL